MDLLLWERCVHCGTAFSTNAGSQRLYKSCSGGGNLEFSQREVSMVVEKVDWSSAESGKVIMSGRERAPLASR